MSQPAQVVPSFPNDIIDFSCDDPMVSLFGRGWRLVGFRVVTPDGIREVWLTSDERIIANSSEYDDQLLQSIIEDIWWRAHINTEFPEYEEDEFDRTYDREIRQRQLDMSDTSNIQTMYPREMYDLGETYRDGPRFVRVFTPAGPVDICLTKEERQKFASGDDLSPTKGYIKILAYGKLAIDNPHLGDMLTNCSPITPDKLQAATDEYRRRMTQ